MSFWDDLTGASARKDLAKGKAAYESQLVSGRDLALGSYQSAADQFAPYASVGTGSTTRWADLMGLNGDAARSTAQSGYLSDPIYTALGNRALQGVARGVASSGQTGAGIQAGTNALLANYNQYLNGLLSGAGIGLQGAAGASSAITRQGDTQFLTGQQLASGEQSYANAMAASRSTAINNLLGLGSLAVSAYTGYRFPTSTAPNTASTGTSRPLTTADLTTSSYWPSGFAGYS